MASKVVVDSSVLVAMSLKETGWDVHLEKLLQCPESYVSAATLLETGLVLWRRLHADERRGLFRLLDDTQTHIEPFGETTYRYALDAFLRFGKGVHPAGLNFGDCIAYATARQLDAALLFVGEDFAKTDIEVA